MGQSVQASSVLLPDVSRLSQACPGLGKTFPNCLLTCPPTQLGCVRSALSINCSNAMISKTPLTYFCSMCWRIWSCPVSLRGDLRGAWLCSLKGFSNHRDQDILLCLCSCARFFFEKKKCDWRLAQKLLGHTLELRAHRRFTSGRTDSVSVTLFFCTSTLPSVFSVLTSCLCLHFVFSQFRSCSIFPCSPSHRRDDPCPSRQQRI